MEYRKYLSEQFFIPNTNQLQFFESVQKGHNIILTACAGSGKSRCIQVLVKKYKDLLVSATTGFAANLIGGVTIDYVITYLERHNIMKFERLIIDEASMMGEYKLLKLDLIFRDLYNHNKPFGGKQLILVGDYLQLPPVLDNCMLYSKYLDRMAFKVIMLRKVYRQSDTTFIKHLDNIRLGIINNDTNEFLQSLSDNDVQDAINIVATNKEAKQINNYYLDALPGDEVVYHRMGYVDGICTRLSKKLRLKVGCHVMLLYNIDTKSGLVNGAKGKVTDITDKGPKILFDNGIHKVITPYTDSHKQIEYINPSEEHIDDILKYADEDILRGFKYTEIKIRQLPLRLSWAITVHKSQGTTLDNIIIDCKHIKFRGQFYTAISRARSHKNVKLINFNKNCIKSDKMIIAQLIHLAKHNEPVMTNGMNVYYEGCLARYDLLDE